MYLNCRERGGLQAVGLVPTSQEGVSGQSL
eukprot:SAG11_NODE_26998_length_338_cov_0.970711_1_plen_29_part_01